MRAIPLLSLLAAGILFPTLGISQPRPKDFGSLLPRIQPTEPTAALKTFHVRAGFHMELVAAEPLLESPVAMDIDEDGRLFVAEFPEYNQYVNPRFHGHGRIRLLEDTQGNGHYDRSTIYADNIDSPLAVACYDGGVFVGAPPDILYCKDSRHDGKADIRRRVYTGFGRDEAGEARLNSFRWGLDNRFRAATGLVGGEIRRTDQPHARPVSMRGQIFLFDPRTLTFEGLSGSLQHGLSMDDWGRMFVCGNSDPVHLVMYDSRYLAGNPYVEAPPAAVNIAPDGKFTHLFRLSPNEPWRVLRTRLRAAGVVPGSAEGGTPSGFFTGATGVTVYRGDAFPAAFRGNVFVGEVANNLIYRARLEPAGLALKAVRADRGTEFLASTDTWFRPVQFANGPDGCLYVIDMYREFIEAAVSVPPDILKHLDVSSGIHRGRIWRIVPDGHRRRPTPKLSRCSTAELVRLLEHPNGWHRETASRLLYQRHVRSAIVPLQQLAATSHSSLGRLHALCALDGLKALTANVVLRALADTDPKVRAQAIRLAEPFAKAPLVRARLLELAADPDVHVRYQVAFSLARVPADKRTAALAGLTRHDGQDPWMRLAILTSASGQAAELLGTLLAEPTFRATATGRDFLTALAGQVGAAAQTDKLKAFGHALERLPGSEQELARRLVYSLVKRQPAGASASLRTRVGTRAASLLADLLNQARRTASDSKQPASARASAVHLLTVAGFNEIRAPFEELLQPQQPQPVQQAVLEGLAGFAEPAAAQLVLDAWPTLSPALRPTAVETLFGRPASLRRFLDAVEHGQIRPGDIDPARIQVLLTAADPGVRTRARRLFAGSRLGTRQKVVAAYQPALHRHGDVAQGRSVFRKVCSRCHRLESYGESVGPDLSSIRNRGLDAVMLNILDPNREVLPQYLSYVIATRSGRLLTGLISAETANSLTIRRADGTSATVARTDIDQLHSTGLSFMPEGLEKEVSVSAMADLLAYLNSIR